MLELIADGPSLTFGEDEQGRPTVEMTVEPWAPAGRAMPNRRRVTVAARVTDDAGLPVLPRHVCEELELTPDATGRVVVQAAVAGRVWATEAVAGPGRSPARIGSGTLEVHGFRLPYGWAARPVPRRSSPGATVPSGPSPTRVAGAAGRKAPAD